MKLLRLLILLILIIFFNLNCSKEDEQIVPETVVEINLISPINSVEENFVFDFIWETNTNEILRFQLDSDESFNSPIIDSLVSHSTNTLKLTKLLAPNSEYYWKLSLDSIQSIASFKTEDIISQYGGIYEMSIRERYESDDGFLDYDTTYSGNLELIVLNDSMKLQSNYGFNGEILSFRENPWNENTLEYENIISSWHHEVSLYIPLDNDTISAFKLFGGLGSKTRWSMYGVKIE